MELYGTYAINTRTFALVATLVTISEFQGFIDPCGGSTGHRSPEQT